MPISKKRVLSSFFSSDTLSHLCNRPDVTVVQNQLFKFPHVREGGGSLGEDGHIGDRRVSDQWSIDHIGDCVGNLDDGFQQNNLIEIVNIYLIRPCAAKLIEII